VVFCGLYPSVFHVVTRKGSNINSFEDIRGTRGAPGPVGGSVEIYVRELLSMVDIGIDDFTPVYSDTTGMIDNVRDGRVDWLCAMAVPSSWVVDLALTGSIDGILPISGSSVMTLWRIPALCSFQYSRWNLFRYA